MGKRWVIPDIHGCSKTFKRLVKRLELNKETDELFLLGDYIDRGPHSRRVVKYILKLREEGYKVRTLKGNHEDIMMKSIQDPYLAAAWHQNGGLITLRSFKVTDPANIKQKYLDFFNSLEYYIVLEDYILVHAGLNFINLDPFEDRHAMLWIRGGRVIPAKVGFRTIIHGHTPCNLKKIKEDIKKKNIPTISIDNGCVYKAVGKGNLVALELNTRELVVQKNIEEHYLIK